MGFLYEIRFLAFLYELPSQGGQANLYEITKKNFFSPPFQKGVRGIFIFSLSHLICNL